MSRSEKGAGTNCKGEFLQNINVILRTNGFVGTASVVKNIKEKEE